VGLTAIELSKYSNKKAHETRYDININLPLPHGQPMGYLTSCLVQGVGHLNKYIIINN
jgi:hypothetical protein